MRDPARRPDVCGTNVQRRLTALVEDRVAVLQGRKDAPPPGWTASLEVLPP